MEIKWIKLSTNIFDDEKIQLIEQLPDADGVIVLWFKLLALAGKQNNNGMIMLSDKIPYTIEMLSTIFRRKQPLVQLALETFKMFGMIDIVDNTYHITNWDKHQVITSRNEYMKKFMANKRANDKADDDVSTNKVLTVSKVSREEYKNKNKKENKKREEESNNNDNGLAETMHHDGRYDQLEKLIIWNYLPSKGKSLSYIEGNLVIDWLKAYPYEYIVEKINSCSLQPETKRSMAYLNGAIQKGWDNYNNGLQAQKGANTTNEVPDDLTEKELNDVFAELKALKAKKG
jgi:predicted phage replisome organizer